MNGKRNSSPAKKISLGGILLAFVTLVLLLAVYSPVNELSLFVLSSFFVAVIVVELGIKAGWIFYISSCLLALIIIPDKIGVLPYVIFFGVYGIVKSYIERPHKIVFEYLIKLVYFNLYILLSFVFLKEFIQVNFIDKIPFPWWAVIIILEVLFVVYDYVYTLFVQYYNERIKRILKL